MTENTDHNEFNFSGEFDNIDSVDDLLGNEPEKTEVPAEAQELPPMQEGTEFYAWQVCHADEATNSIMDADDFPDYIVNRETITQMLGIGMASGQNAFPLNGQMFVVAVSIQVGEGEIKLIGPEHPRYQALAAVISEELLKGQDRGMIADLPNGTLVAIKPPADPDKL